MLTLGLEAAPTAQVAAAGGVDILGTARVAGLDATIVRADDAETLASWLGERGYENRPALVRWLEPYVEEGFTITAFQFAKGADATEALGSRSVRMSFETDRPFYPYREPDDHPEEPGRELRVFVVAAERAHAGLTSGGDWSADIDFAAPLADASSVLGDSAMGLSGPLWLTSFDDRVASRAAADLRFDVRAGDEVRPAPVVVPGSPRPLPIPIEPALVLGAGVWWWRRRKARGGRDG
jgi:hypothetical protein